MSEAFLSIENVAMYFGGLHALDDVSFEVERGWMGGWGVTAKAFRNNRD